MTTFPSVTGKDWLLALKKAGFSWVPVKGGYHFPQYADGRSIVIPVHAGETIGLGLISKILRDCELSRERLQTMLNANICLSHRSNGPATVNIVATDHYLT